MMDMQKEARKAKALMSKYPYMGESYRSFCSTRGRGEKDLELRAVVRRADPSLMYRRAKNAIGYRKDGWCNWIQDLNGNKATLFEYGQCVLENEKVFLFQNIDSMFTSNNGYLAKYSDLPCSIKYILWVKTYEWYEADEETEEGVGSFIKTEIRYEIHLPPKTMSFPELVKFADPLKNVEIVNSDVTEGIIKGDPVYTQVGRDLDELSKVFETKVFNQGLGEMIDASEKRGMSGSIGGVKIMSYVMSGRIMITLQAPNLINSNLLDDFTMIGQESTTNARLSYQSICSTVDRAKALVEMVAKGWSAIEPQNRPQAFADDTKVGIF